MKQKLLIILLAASVPFIGNAQFGNVLGKVKSKVNQRIDRKVDKAIDETLDKTEKEATSGNLQPAKKNKVARQKRRLLPVSQNMILLQVSKLFTTTILNKRLLQSYQPAGIQMEPVKL
jgi:hypothetical protein